MPPPYDRHVFVCLHDRWPESARGSCAQKGSEALLKQLKDRCREEGIDSLRVNKAGCLDNCELGISIVVYPEGVWYGRVQPSDVDEIVQSHLKEGRPVERLRLYGEEK